MVVVYRRIDPVFPRTGRGDGGGVATGAFVLDAVGHILVGVEMVPPHGGA